MHEIIEALEYHSSQPAGKIEIRTTKPFVRQQDLPWSLGGGRSGRPRSGGWQLRAADHGSAAGRGDVEIHFAALDPHLDTRVGLQVVGQDQIGQWVFDLALDQAA